jgi:hypothetical protein
MKRGHARIVVVVAADAVSEAAVIAVDMAAIAAAIKAVLADAVPSLAGKLQSEQFFFGSVVVL